MIGCWAHRYESLIFIQDALWSKVLKYLIEDEPVPRSWVPQDPGDSLSNGSSWSADLAAQDSGSDRRHHDGGDAVNEEQRREEHEDDVPEPESQEDLFKFWAL